MRIWLKRLILAPFVSIYMTLGFLAIVLLTICRILVDVLDDLVTKFLVKHRPTEVDWEEEEASCDRPKTCRGCIDYEGDQYWNRPKFICGIYPYGFDGEKCPDWRNKK